MKFRFSSAEKNGLIALIVIIIVLQVSIFLVKCQLNSQNTILLSDEEHKLFQEKLDSITGQFANNEFSKPDYTNIEFFEFNPNKINQDDLVRLGFSKGVAQTFINYREKVKPFQANIDLFNVYGIDSSLVLLLLPYVTIEQTKMPHEKVLEVPKKKVKTDSLFKFNPNSISHNELLKLGFSNKLASTFINYRQAISGFETKDQIKNIYGLSEEFFQELNPYILFPENKKELKRFALEINAATVNDFKKLTGIGAVLSNRIIKYRNYLGGFYSIEQLKNVYGLSEATFNNIKNTLIADASLIETINVNFVGVSELTKLPGCNEELAEQIIDFRSQNGALKELDQLKIIVGEKEFEVLKYYLRVK